MKTFMNTCVLAVVLGVTMSGGTAKANFDNNAVAEFASQLENLAKLIDDAALRDAGVPRGQRVVFLAGLRSIAQDASQIVELAAAPDNQVEDQIKELTRRMRRTAKGLADRAEDLDLEAVEDFFNDFADNIDDLNDKVR